MSADGNRVAGNYNEHWASYHDFFTPQQKNELYHRFGKLESATRLFRNMAGSELPNL